MNKWIEFANELINLNQVKRIAISNDIRDYRINMYFGNNDYIVCEMYDDVEDRNERYEEIKKLLCKK